MKHILGFSGGSDSQATALWLRQRFPIEDILLLNSTVGGNEHPMTTEFIRRYSGTVHPVVMIDAEVRDMGKSAPDKIRELGLEPSDPLTFDLLAKLKGQFPGTKSRFCTEFL